VYDETINNSCARARFAGCTYLRNIILALNTVYLIIKKYLRLCPSGQKYNYMINYLSKSHETVSLR
jgi:hypothetical protein